MNSTPRMPRSVFVAHAPEDQAFADLLMKMLAMDGFQAWHDPADTLNSDGTPAVLDKGLRETESLVVVLSSAALNTPCLREQLRCFVPGNAAGRTYAVVLEPFGEDAPLMNDLRGAVSINCSISKLDGLRKLAAAMSARSPALPPACDEGRRQAHPLLPIPQPTLLVGPGSSAPAGPGGGRLRPRKVLIVTDRHDRPSWGLLRGLTDALDAGGGAAYAVFDEITPDAPIPLIERGIAVLPRARLRRHRGRRRRLSMDASKAIAVSIANPRKGLRELAGYSRGCARRCRIYAVPTTAGTGSEVTVAAVISDPERQSKLVIVDTRMVPKMAALDPTLMTGLPPAITAATGIDALTHAVEAFVGNWATPQTDGLALSAVG
jgi:hypothetical protein